MEEMGVASARKTSGWRVGMRYVPHVLDGWGKPALWNFLVLVSQACAAPLALRRLRGSVGAGF